MSFGRETGRELGEEMETLDRAFREATGSAAGLTRAFSKDVAGALNSVIREGESFGDVFKKLALNLSDSTLNKAISPLVNGFSDWAAKSITSGFAFRDGGVFQNGRVTAFARGGVVSGPSVFSMSNGTGLMGEAGPEAILPLGRGADGRLGVNANMPRKETTINVQIKAQDVESFRASKSQIAAQLGRAITHSNRKD